MTLAVLSRKERVACSGVLVLVLGLLAAKAGTEGLASFYVQSGSQLVGVWMDSRRLPREDEWTGALSYVSDGLRFAPNGAWPLEEMGALQLQRVRIATDPQIGQAAARAAHFFLRRALPERPTSPFAWANLALAKLYLGEVDSELFDALAHSQELGPWEPEVQQALAFVGLAVWGELGADARAMIVQAMERIARKEPNRALEIGAAFNRLDLVCGKGTAASLAGPICSRAHDSTKQAKRL
jgi:hypothetical protein